MLESTLFTCGFLFLRTGIASAGLLCGETTFGELSSPSDVAVFPFYLSQPTHMAFDTCGSDFDTFLMLFYYTPHSTLHVQNLTARANDGNCGYAARLADYLIPHIYLLLLTDVGRIENQENGSYQIHVQCNKTSYKILDSLFSTLDEAEIACEETFGTTLATIITDDDAQRAMQVYNKSGYNLRSISAWVGLYHEFMNESQWQWIAGSYGTDSSEWLPFESTLLINYTNEAIFMTYDEYRAATVLTFVNDTTAFNLQFTEDRVSHTALCNSPHTGSIQPAENCLYSYGNTNCWLHWFRLVLRNVSDTTMPQLAFWNDQLFIMEMYQMRVYNMDDIDIGYVITSEILYNTNFNEPKAKGSVQYESSFYVYFINTTSDTYTKHVLMYINLVNLEIEPIRIPSLWSTETIACMAADAHNVYIIVSSLMLIYNIQEDEWYTTNILDHDPAACVMDRDETFIYIFGLYKRHISKYDIASKWIFVLDERNLCSTNIGKAIRAPNGEAYLHGCYIGGWKTLIFNIEEERFEREIGGIQEINTYDVASYHWSQSVLFGHDNILHMAHITNIDPDPTINVLQTYVLATDIFAINFQSTSTQSAVWPSDELIIYYTISSTLDDNNVSVSVDLFCDYITYVINETLLLSSIDDHCDKVWYKFMNCSQPFALYKYLSVFDNDVEELDIFIHSREAHNYSQRFDIIIIPLIVEDFITITLQRCNISFDIINTRSYSYDPSVNIRYNIDPLCYTRNGTDFEFNITMFSDNNPDVNTHKHATISIVNNDTYICKLCELNQSCSFCNDGIMEMKHRIWDQDGTLNILFASNHIDLIIHPKTPFYVEYFRPEMSTKEVLKKLKLWQIVLIAIGSLIFIIIVGGIIAYCWRKNKQLQEHQEQHTHYIKNPMLLSIGISLYMDDVEEKGIDVFCMDLDGIDADYTNLRKLCKLLDYDMYPKEMKLQWTQNEILTFIERQAEEAVLNMDSLMEDPRDPHKKVDGYDAIMMVFSGHGFKNNIITSDYKLMSKTAIHRILSVKYPRLREIPRICFFDCCDGGEQRSTYAVDEKQDSTDDDDDDEIEAGKGVQTSDEITSSANKQDQGKHFNIDDINRTTSMWKRDQKNPDYKLALIHAANEGFQAKMNSVDGSYLIYEFVKQMIMSTSDMFLGEIVDSVQEYLHDEGKQQITSSFNNNTRYIRFIENKETKEIIKQKSKQVKSDTDLGIELVYTKNTQNATVSEIIYDRDKCEDVDDNNDCTHV